MKAEIITIGDEILIGQVVDTNSAWIAEQLNLNGIRLHQITSISDDEAHIIKALDEAKSRADLVLMTGGLGPTRDDITKQTLAKYFNTELKLNEKVFEHIKKLFARFNVEVTELNRQQAILPVDCELIWNKIGTAPGMWFEKDETVFVSMPGVPYEMKRMVKKEIFPRLKERFQTPHIVHRTILTTGIGESFLADKISDWEDSLEGTGIRLAYLPSPGLVRLRLSLMGNDENDIQQQLESKVRELKETIPQYIFGEGDQKLEELIGELLREKKMTVSTAESCTGGKVAHLITSVAGSSDYFLGGAVTYSNESKMQILGVKKETLEKHGAVSEQTVIEMSQGACEKFNSDFGIATSGIAGPGGGTEEKPVGTVWIAIAGPGGVKTKKYRFGDKRGRNIDRSSVAALEMLRKAVAAS